MTDERQAGLREALHANGIGCSKFDHDPDDHAIDERIILSALAVAQVPAQEYRCLNCGRDENGCECEGGGTLVALPAQEEGLDCHNATHIALDDLRQAARAVLDNADFGWGEDALHLSALRRALAAAPSEDRKTTPKETRQTPK